MIFSDTFTESINDTTDTFIVLINKPGCTKLYQMAEAYSKIGWTRVK